MEQRPKMRGREVESKSKSEIHCFFQKQKQMWNHSMIIIQVKFQCWVKVSISHFWPLSLKKVKTLKALTQPRLTWRPEFCHGVLTARVE